AARLRRFAAHSRRGRTDGTVALRLRGIGVDSGIGSMPVPCRIHPRALSGASAWATTQSEICPVQGSLMNASGCEVPDMPEASEFPSEPPPREFPLPPVESPSTSVSSTRQRIAPAKLFPPTLQANMLARPRLLSLLNREPVHRLTVISGPAGYG